LTQISGFIQLLYWPRTLALLLALNTTDPNVCVVHLFYAYWWVSFESELYG